MTCPWCGDEADDSPEELPFPVDADEICIPCGGCDHPLRVRRVVQVTYLCEKEVTDAE